MNGYFIKSSNITPAIYFDPENQILDIRGKSAPLEPLRIYEQVYDSIDQYKNSGHKKLKVNLALKSVDTSSFKCLYTVLKKLDLSGKIINLNWYYENDNLEMKDKGMEVSKLINIQFNLKDVNEIKVEQLERIMAY